MKKPLLALFGLCFGALAASADVTLDQCLSAAHDNYPLIKKYELLSKTEDIQLSDINKGWLPRIGIYAQGTAQNIVPSFPASLSNVMQQMGGEVRGLGKIQYRLGADINQTIWDGGASKAQRETVRARTAVDQAALDVEMYGIRSRVESLYFGILLMESQIEQTENAIGVFQANLDRIKAMLKNGTAMTSDADLIEAQMLTMDQQLTSARAATKGYRDMLAIFTGLDLSGESLVLPSADVPTTLQSERPELSLFESRRNLSRIQRNSISATLMPKVGFFAQSYYGYPGIDYFKAMMQRNLSFNIIAGVKASWNIDSFYTKKNSLTRLDIADLETDTDQETFLFNSSLQTSTCLDEIKGIEEVMKSDDHILQLRANVRKAAESQLRNGVIDATALTTKINDETQAALTAKYHIIQRLQAIYNLKNTLNR